MLAVTAFATVGVACRYAADAPVGGHLGTSGAVAASTAGYLLPEERPDSAALVPPPPAAGSAEMAADEATYRMLKPLAGSARWRLAAADANVKFPEAANVFGCALGLTVSESATPHLYTLLQRAIIDAGQSTSAAKDKYNRSRPFETTGDATCVPQDEKVLRNNASYPSGHGSLGFVWGEILAEVAPDRAAAVRARGYQFGQSRVLCRVHWQSDVVAGRMVGAAVMPRLHQDDEFLADLAAAKAEAARARTRGPPADHDCSAEASALQVTTAP